MSDEFNSIRRLPPSALADVNSANVTACVATEDRIAFVENTQRLRQALRTILGFLPADTRSPAEATLVGDRA